MFKDIPQGTTHHDKDACYKCEKCGSHLAPTHLLIHTPKHCLTKRYRGKGRPRKSDYDYVDLIKNVKEITK